MATLTWTGAGADSFWGTAGNWSPAQAPAAGDIIVFNFTANNPCIVNANTATVASINFNAYQGTVTINNGINLVVGGNVTLSTSNLFDITTLATGTLTISANSSLMTNGRTINCILRLINTNVNPATPTIVTVSLMDNVTMSKGFVAGGSPVGTVVLQSSVLNTQRQFTLQNIEGVTQDIDFLNVIDIDGNQGVTMWSYQGATPVNSKNWYVMSTQPPPTSGFAIG